MVFGVGGGTSSYEEVENAESDRALGFERPRDTPDLLPPCPHRHPQRRAAGRRRSAAHDHVGVGGPLARPRHRLRHRARERRRARDHRRRPRERRLRRAGHRALRGVPRVRRALHAGARRGDLGRAPRGDPRAGARLWERRARATLLDARHHRASQRDRPRAGADQPRIADRPRRPLRLRPQPVARPEQRAGRRRHGRRAEQAARLPGRRGRRGARPLRGRMGNLRCRRATAGTSRRCSRRWSAASCARST